jgi:hypothetical protein
MDAYLAFRGDFAQLNENEQVIVGRAFLQTALYSAASLLGDAAHTLFPKEQDGPARGRRAIRIWLKILAPALRALSTQDRDLREIPRDIEKALLALDHGQVSPPFVPAKRKMKRWNAFEIATLEYQIFLCRRSLIELKVPVSKIQDLMKGISDDLVKKWDHSKRNVLDKSVLAKLAAENDDPYFWSDDWDDAWFAEPFEREEIAFETQARKAKNYYGKIDKGTFQPRTRARAAQMEWLCDAMNHARSQTP